MRFLSIYKSVERGTPPTAEEMAAMGKLIEEAARAGWLLATEGCLPSALGARVRLADGKVTVTDGPFTEAKEVVGGFAILQAESKEEAIELTRRFLDVAGEGECELRQLYEAPAFDAGSSPGQSETRPSGQVAVS
ncbi:MAG TPA: YciI family protein [Chloroflexota bacterium]